MTTPEERTRAVIEMGREVMALAPYLHGKSETVRVPREVLRFLAAPTDVNWGGKVHGGNVMRWIDEGRLSTAVIKMRVASGCSSLTMVRNSRPVSTGIC